MRNQQYAQEYLEHVALLRELLDQASLSTNSTLLSLSNKRITQWSLKLHFDEGTHSRVEFGSCASNEGRCRTGKTDNPVDE